MIEVGPGKHRAAEGDAAEVTDTGPVIETRAQSPIIFLLGPPGAGKSALGSRACNELGLEFLELAVKPATSPTTGEICSDMERFSRVIEDRAADVIELPWPLQQERKELVLARKSSVPLLLWPHPEDMQARSGREERLFTPVPRRR